MMSNRRGQLFQNIVLGLLVFSMFTTGLFFALSTMAADHGITVNESLSEPFDTAEDIRQIGNDLGTSFEESEAQSTSNIVTFISTGVGGFKIIFTSFTLIQQVVFATSNELGVPAFIVTTVITTFLILMGFAIVGYLSGVGKV